MTSPFSSVSQIPRLLTRAALSLCLFLAVFSAQAQQKIVKVVVENIGPPAASESLVRSNIRSKEGEDYSRLVLDQDIKNLYGTGLFYNVRAAGQNSPQGFVITFVIEGKPRLTDVKFSGNKRYSNNRLTKKLKSKVGEPLNEQKLFADSQAIQEMYEKAGYQKTTVRYETSIDEAAGTGTATFIVRETPKIKIKDIIFEHATAFKQRDLRKVLKTKRRWMFSWLTGSGVLKEEEFEDDKDRLTEHYQNAGYIDFAIKAIRTNFVTPTRMVLTFDLFEGRLYKVGKVEFKGNTVFTTNDFLNGVSLETGPHKPPPLVVRWLTPNRPKATLRMKMLTGRTFRPVGDTKNPGLQSDLDTLKDMYGSRGYVERGRGGATAIVARQLPNPATGTMDLVYEIEEGDKLYIEKIEIKGNTKTKDRVIRRELAVSPGEVYDMVRVKLSEQRLKNLDYFEKVESTPEDTDVGPAHKNLVIGVDEKSTGNLVVGAGFSSVDAIVGFAEVSEGNFDIFKPPTFRGGGQKFRLRAQLGTQRQDYEMTFVEPWLFGRKLSFGVNLFHRDLGFVSLNDMYDEIHSGGTLSLTRALGSDFIIGKVSYTFDSVDTKINSGFHTNSIPSFSPGSNPFFSNQGTQGPNISQEIWNERGNRVVSKLGFSVAYDTANSALLPTKGQHTELLTEIAGGPLGGDTDFYKVELRSAVFFKGFHPGHVLELDGRTGVVQGYGDPQHVPISDRFFLGGLESLRGFRYRQVGPTDQFGEPLGGSTYWYGTAEYSIPVIERIRFAAFYDIGNVYSSPFSFSVGHDSEGRNRVAFSDNWGLGLRLDLPIGPLRLDYGIPINHDQSVSGSGRFQFGVGYRHSF
jgi:outer membrane protein insertion porin family